MNENKTTHFWPLRIANENIEYKLERKSASCRGEEAVSNLERLARAQLEIPRWSLVLICSFVLFVFVCLLASVTLLLTRPSQRAYGESCERRVECLAAGLECVENKCGCLREGFVFTNRCVSLFGYGEACLSDQQCHGRLVCRTGECICGMDEFWDGYECQARRGVNQSCWRDINCRSDLVCVPHRLQCDCYQPQRFYQLFYIHLFFRMFFI